MWIRRADDGPWYPGEWYTLQQPDRSSHRGSRLDDNIYERYIKGEEAVDYNLMGGTGGRLTPAETRHHLEMLSFYHQLTPPKYYRRGNKDPENVIASRQICRELDLSAWFTRPCVIVMGYLQLNPDEAVTTPVPFQVNGRRPASDGMVMVRWIYPLPLDETKLWP